MRMRSVTGPHTRLFRIVPTTALALAAILLVGCSRSRDQTGEFYTHWDIAGGCNSGIVRDDWVDASGQVVDVCSYPSRADWVWVTYAAGWCGASRTQAVQIRSFTHSAASQVEVFTVLTSGDEVFSPVNSGHARAWAAQLRSVARTGACSGRRTGWACHSTTLADRPGPLTGPCPPAPIHTYAESVWHL